MFLSDWLLQWWKTYNDDFEKLPFSKCGSSISLFWFLEKMRGFFESFKFQSEHTLSPFIAYVENILKIIAQYSKSNMFFTHSKRLLFLIIQLTKHEIFLKNNSNFMWGWSYGVYRVKFRLVLSSQQWLSEVKRTTFSFILFPG